MVNQIIGVHYSISHNGDEYISEVKVRRDKRRIEYDNRDVVILSITMFNANYITHEPNGHEAVVSVVTINKHAYLRTDRNNIETDNLGSLPRY